MMPQTLSSLLLLQVTACLIAGLAASLLLRRHAAKAHAALVIALLAALISPLATMTVSRLGWGILKPAEAQIETVSAAPEPVAVSSPSVLPMSGPRVDSHALAPLDLAPGETPSPVAAAPIDSAVTEAPPSTSFAWPSLSTLIAFVWGLTSLWLTVRVVVATWQARRVVATRSPVEDSSLQSALATAAERLALRITPELGRAHIESPVVWCWGRRPVVLLPLATDPQNDWVGIFSHELAHWQRGDHLAGGFAQLLVILLPWHPCTWWARRRLQELSEQSCDQWAVADGRSAIDYAESLVKLQPQRRPHFALAAVRSKKLLVVRVERLLNSHPDNPRVTPFWKWGACSLTLVAAGLLALAQAAPQASIAPAETAAEVAPAARMTVSGRILLANGKPAVGAQVAIVGRKKATIRGGDFAAELPKLMGLMSVNADGRFSLDVPRTSSNGFYHATALATLPGQGFGFQILELDARSPQVDMVLPEERLFRGRVVGLQGEPAANAAVHVEWIGLKTRRARGEPSGIQYWSPPDDLPFWPKPAKTGADGRFVLRGLGAGQSIRVQIRDPRFALGFHSTLNGSSLNSSSSTSGTTLASSPNSGSTTVSGTPAEKEPTLVVSPSQTISGTVTCADTGKPSPRARVTVFASNMEGGGGTGISVVADEHGHFEANPFTGSHFQVTAFAVDGEPYLAFRKLITWKKGALRQTVNLQLPRGVLVRGKLTEAENGRDVAGAGVTYFENSSNKNVTPGMVTEWEYGTVSGPDGSFQMALPPGKGHLLVSGPGSDFIHQEVGSRMIRSGRPGGVRMYPDALIPVDVAAGKDRLEVAAKLRRGVTLRGRLIGPAGEPIQKAQMVCNLNVSPQEFTWRLPVTLFGGEFEIHGCDPEKPVSVMFLDPDHEWGLKTTFDPRTAKNSIETVRLQQCGSARVRYLDKNRRPIVKAAISPELVVTPGAFKYEYKNTELAADSDLYGNIDRVHYWDGPLTDADGRISYPCLIPGAQFQITEGSGGLKQEFTAVSGKTIELPDVQFSR